MNKKIISLNIKTIVNSNTFWHDESYFYDRLKFFLKTELSYVSEQQEEKYKTIVGSLINMYESTSVKNIFKLIGKEHLGRKLLSVNMGINFNIDNHLGQIELMVLEKNISHCWHIMTPEEKNAVVKFAQKKTVDTLGSHAECFTLSLKDFVSGLTEITKTFKTKLVATTRARRNFYREPVASF